MGRSLFPFHAPEANMSVVSLSMRSVPAVPVEMGADAFPVSVNFTEVLRDSTRLSTPLFRRSATRADCPDGSIFSSTPAEKDFRSELRASEALRSPILTSEGGPTSRLIQPDALALPKAAENSSPD